MKTLKLATVLLVMLLMSCSEDEVIETKDYPIQGTYTLKQITNIQTLAVTSVSGVTLTLGEGSGTLSDNGFSTVIGYDYGGIMYCLRFRKSVGSDYIQHLKKFYFVSLDDKLVIETETGKEMVFSIN